MFVYLLLNKKWFIRLFILMYKILDIVLRQSKENKYISLNSYTIPMIGSIINKIA